MGNAGPRANVKFKSTALGARGLIAGDRFPRRRNALALLVAIIIFHALTTQPPAIADETADSKKTKTVEEICTPILEARRGLRSGEMLIVREGWTARDGKKDRRQSMLHLWFDGAKCRLEELHEPWTDRNGKESPRFTENTCRGCYSNTTFVWHSDRPVSPGKMAVVVADIGLRDIPRYQLPNPRLFGLGAKNLHNCDWADFDHFIGNKARTDEAVVLERYKDEECLKVEYRLPPPPPQEISSSLRFWVSPKQGGSIVRLEHQGKYKEVEFISTLECENQKSPDAVIWYPRRLVWESKKVGAEPLTHEEAQVTLVSLNQPIDPAVFSFKAIRSITPGLFVSRESKERDPNFFNDQIVTIREGRDVHHATAVWNGEKLVSQQESEKMEDMP